MPALPPPEAEEIIAHLQSLGDPQIAAHSQRFFKTGEGEYGSGDRFLGIRVPVVRQAVRKYRHASRETAVRLLHSEFHEIRLFALILLVSRYSAYPGEQESIYRLYLDNTDQINNWDLVDCSAPQIIGTHLFARKREILHTLSMSSSLWERRIALLASFHFIRNRQYSDTLGIVETVLDDHQDLIHKAAGWMLREIGKRELAVELDFLNRHYKQMPRTMLRYAIEKLEESLRQQYLKGEI